MTENKIHVILLSCGSFNPITRGHIHMFGEVGGRVCACVRVRATHRVFKRSKLPVCSDSESNIRDNEQKSALRSISARQREAALPWKHAQSHSNARIL